MKTLRIWLVSFMGVVAGFASADVPRLENQRELFLDDFLLYKLVGVENRLAHPTPAGVALELHEPWEGRFSGAFVTVLRDGEKYRMYYRGIDERPGGLHEVTCLAESADGVKWTKPALDVFASEKAKDNNIVIAPNPQRTAHNFSVIVDNRPGVPADQRYKAVGGGMGTAVEHKANGSKRGLYRYTSADGIHWKRVSEEPLFTNWALDTHNVLAWIPSENRFAVYMRAWTLDRPGKLAYKGVRLIARSTSTDFENWSEPEIMTYGDAPLENLYTNATAPYFRAPQLLIALPFRFAPDRRLLTEAQMREEDIHESMWSGVSDAVIMTSRGGTTYQRHFIESFVRPGLDLSNWAARSNIPALGVVQTSATEMSLYLTCGYGSKNRRIERMTLRLDGFASLHAGYDEGYALTKPMTLAGNTLELNFSASSIGYVKVVVLDEEEREIPGFGLADATEMAGDFIAQPVRWKNGKTIEELKGKVIRLKFVLRDADLYSLGVFQR